MFSVKGSFSVVIGWGNHVSLAFHLGSAGSDVEPTIWPSSWFDWVANASQQLWVQYITHVICYFMWAKETHEKVDREDTQLVARKAW